jgi:hypothetical protein
VPPRASKCAAPASDSSPETPAGAIRASGGTKGRARARPPPPPGPPLTGCLRAASSADLSEFRRGSLNEKSLPVKLQVPHLALNLHSARRADARRRRDADDGEGRDQGVRGGEGVRRRRGREGARP